MAGIVHRSRVARIGLLAMLVGLTVVVPARPAVASPWRLVPPPAVTPHPAPTPLPTPAPTPPPTPAPSKPTSSKPPDIPDPVGPSPIGPTPAGAPRPGDAPPAPLKDDELPPPKQVDLPDDLAEAADDATDRASERAENHEAPAPAGAGRCAKIDSAADPMRLIDAVLDGLEKQGFVLGPRLRAADLRGAACATSLQGGDASFLYYQLQRTADEGYVFVLLPTGPQQQELIARPALENEERGILLANVERLRIAGRYLPGDSSVRLRKILGLEPGNLSPAAISAQLQQLGYRARFTPEGKGEITVTVEPGRSIRRVRVRGHIPLSKRDIQRELSVAARPGALARGDCTTPKAARREPRPSICAPDDPACAQWEADEIERLERYMFDKGYLRGKADLALVCGRNSEEADLHVYLKKGPAYRVPWRKLTVHGNMPPADQRWMRRAFWPRVRATPFPARLTREWVDDAKERAERRYAEPRDNIIQATAAPQLSLPYPEIQIETSYENLRRGEVPPGNKIPLDVTVDLGRGVKSSFLGNRSFSDLRLRSQLQLFKRRESPSVQAAVREAANLRAYYQSKGFLLASVRGRYEEFGSKAPGALYFQINEGPLTTIRSVEQVITRGVPPRVANDIERQFDLERKLKRGGRFTEAHVVDDLTALITRFQDRGYLCARAVVDVAFWPEGLNRKGEHATADVDTILRREPNPTWAERDFSPAGLAALRKRGRANLYVRITVEPGPRVFTARRNEQVRYLDVPIPGDRNIEDLPVHTDGEWGARRIFSGTPMRREGDTRPGGVAVSLGLDRDVEEAVIDRYRDSGFPIADAELRWLYTDPATGQVMAVPNARRLADPDIGMCQAFTSGTAVELEAELSVYEGKKGTFGDTLLRGNFKTRGWALRRQFAHQAGAQYRRADSEQTRDNIDGLGVAESVDITPYPVGCELDSTSDECVVHHVLEMRESKDYALKLEGGFGFATLDPFYVFLHPTFANMWGTAWDLELLGHYGFNTSNVPAGVPFLGDCAGQRCYERSARANLTRQRIFASPLTFSLGGQYQQRLTPARGRIDSAIGTLTFTYPINKRWQTYFGYLIQRSNISQDVVKPVFDPAVPEDGGAAGIVNRRDAIVSDRTGALQVGFNYTNVEDNPFNPDDGILASADLKFASPYLGGIDWFIRADLSWQHFIPIPRTQGRLNFRYALRYGQAIPLPGLPLTDTRSVPEIWRYFGGGTVDLGVRGLLPETMLVDIERIDVGGGVQRLHYVAQGGHIRALATIALQVVSINDFLGGKIAHSLFFDFGILTQKWSQVQFNRDFRRSVGINFLQWNIKIVTLALGYAVLLPNAIAPGNVKPIDDRNGRFVFDVGIVF
ncbi:MAG: BamA/TamA family outer membrane protein [Nannocystis sp.]|nr:BamA/TamA family outer membrane protein [Nannocystis sp.]MBA3547661.1 BamA/TamA family outer membrane protein [Nannocystis sp.]